MPYRRARLGAAVQTTATSFDVERVRADFPILREPVHGRPLVYLDNAATSQKPEAVIQAMCIITDTTTPTFIAACTCCRSAQPRTTKRCASRFSRISMRERRARSSLCAAPLKPSISWRRPMAATRRRRR